MKFEVHNVKLMFYLDTHVLRTEQSNARSTEH